MDPMDVDDWLKSV
jgi:hypothetical protein